MQVDAFPGSTREISAAPPLCYYRETPSSACLLLSCVTLYNPQVQLKFLKNSPQRNLYFFLITCAVNRTGPYRWEFIHVRLDCA